MKSTWVVAMTVALLFCSHVFSGPSGGRSKTFPSPDGRFVASIDADDTGITGRLHVEEVKTERVYSSGMFAPILLKWTGNSRSFICVEHIAGGSMAVLHSCENEWDRQQFDPPEEFTGHYAVVGLEVGFDSATIVCKELRDQAHSPEPRCYVSKFRVDTKTGIATKIDGREISGKTYRDLQLSPDGEQI